ncbi:MAG: hypothetical protein NUV52_04065 [Candidatus Roizmanbacteria bacterium]|nr:hypothetical protein [Candidatus Roizmanbacteria bacterium]
MDQNNQNQGGVNSPQQPVAAQPATPQVPTVEDIQKKLNEQLSEAMQTPAAPQNPAQDMVAPQPSAPAPEPIPTPSPMPPAPEPEPVVPQVSEPMAPVTPAPVMNAPVPTPEAAPTGTSVTIYTIENCPFCKAEKEYLAKEGMQFNEKRVDANEADLKEMLELSDNFAGVPVTLIKTGDRQRVIKGFTQADFEQELVNLGLKQGTPMPVQAAAPSPMSPSEISPSAQPPAQPEPMQPPTSPSGISAEPQPAVAAPMPAEPTADMPQPAK